MRALVVYESMYGNTRAVAEAIAEGVAHRVPVDTVEIGSAPETIDLELTLLVVGGPTHAFQMSTPDTRRSAAQRVDVPVVSRDRGMREWLRGLRIPAGTAVAVFDTRLARPRWFWGSAARAAARHLRRRGVGLIATPANFYVAGPRGPVTDALLAGELDRARRWGAQLAATCLPAAHDHPSP